ncbi:hypothetical protein [Pseudoalteromonas marina]|uniref:Uncharacterized protein n=1 Tax=Pseudoalteromonas marina TaxID=267375 RepID=A0ABT9FCF1_9GAMM|nr:hypothetical protein [Pseudoalteromonas marina]MDP2564457.1 hypothetical protein [Pseudoalteromonas marina]
MDTNSEANTNTDEGLKIEITREQFDTLSGFFVHLWCVKYEGSKPDFGFYQERLDGIGIPWWVQNKVSELAEVRENAFLYFRTIFQKAGITVSAA